MRNVITSAIIIVVPVAAAVMTACSDNKHDASVTPESVEVALPETDSVVLSKSYPGYLSAASSVNLVARVNGYLRSSSYHPGDLVQQGQVLFTIEDTQYRDAVQQARAQLETARATYEYASHQYAAMKKALESDAVSQMDVIQAESNMKQAEAAIRNAAAALQTANTNLGYCVVRAPITGHITTSGPSDGDYLAGAGSPVSLATIYDDREVNAYFNVEDNQYMKMIASRNDRKGINYDSVPVIFNPRLPHDYAGKLTYVSPDINRSTGTLRLRIHLKNPYNELKDGMYATVSLPYAVDPDAVLVKAASIGSDQQGRYVYVVNDSGKVVYTPVKVGDLVRDSMRIVTSGLTKNQRYVTKAMLKVRDGMTVRPVMKR